MGLVGTWMGDRLGIPSVVGFLFIFFSPSPLFSLRVCCFVPCVLDLKFKNCSWDSSFYQFLRRSFCVCDGLQIALSLSTALDTRSEKTKENQKRAKGCLRRVLWAERGSLWRVCTMIHLDGKRQRKGTCILCLRVTGNQGGRSTRVVSTSIIAQTGFRNFIATWIFSPFILAQKLWAFAIFLHPRSRSSFHTFCCTTNSKYCTELRWTNDFMIFQVSKNVYLLNPKAEADKQLLETWKIIKSLSIKMRCNIWFIFCSI